MKTCIVCGELDYISEGQDYRGKRIWLCDTGDCSLEFERDEQDAYEFEIQQAHDEVDARFGYR